MSGNEDFGRRFFYGWAIAFGAVTIVLNGVEAVRLNPGWDAWGAAFTGALPPVVLLVTSHAVIKVVRHTVGRGREVSGGVWIGTLLGIGALGSAAMAFGGSFTALEALAAHWGWAVPMFLPLSIDTALVVMSLGSVWSAMMLARGEAAASVVDNADPVDDRSVAQPLSAFTEQRGSAIGVRSLHSDEPVEHAVAQSANVAVAQGDESFDDGSAVDGDEWLTFAERVRDAANSKADAATVARVLELTEAGGTRRDVGVAVGMSASTVSNLVKVAQDLGDRRPRLTAVR